VSLNEKIYFKFFSKGLEDIVRLIVPPQNVNDKKEPEKRYKYSQLVELNDKLTLVVGKDKKQQELIKYFSDV